MATRSNEAPKDDPKAPEDAPRREGGAGADRADRIYEQTRNLGVDARVLGDDVEGLARETTAFVQHQMTVRPYVTLGVAAGLGYVLGGGVPRWMARAAISIGVRSAVTAVARQAASGSMQGMAGEYGATGDAPEEDD